jgi:hypothetical protein
MDVGGFVGMHVMMPMMGRPPDGSALHGRSAEQAEDELTGARGLETAVRKVAMIEAGNGEHAHHVKDARDGERHPAETHPEDRQANGMHRDERQHSKPIDARARVRVRGSGGEVVMSEPTRQLASDSHRARRGGRGRGFSV